MISGVFGVVLGFVRLGGELHGRENALVRMALPNPPLSPPLVSQGWSWMVRVRMRGSAFCWLRGGSPGLGPRSAAYRTGFSVPSGVGVRAARDRSWHF